MKRRLFETQLLKSSHVLSFFLKPLLKKNKKKPQKLCIPKGIPLLWLAVWENPPMVWIFHDIERWVLRPQPSEPYRRGKQTGTFAKPGAKRLDKGSQNSPSVFLNCGGGRWERRSWFSSANKRLKFMRRKACEWIRAPKKKKKKKEKTLAFMNLFIRPLLTAGGK